jgi:hypothetical protein
MGLSPCLYTPATPYGYSGYCLPVDHATGNPLGPSIRSTEWAQKYNYSKAQLRTLLRDRKITAVRHKGILYVFDSGPALD